MIISDLIKRLLSVGIPQDAEANMRKKIRMTNEMALIFSFSAIIYILVFVLLGAIVAGYCLVGFSALFMSVIYINYLGRFTLSKVVLILSLYAGIACISALLGPSSLVDVIYVSILAVPFAITDRSDSYLNWLALTLSVVLYSICNFTDLMLPYMLEGVERAIQYPVALFIFAMPFLVMGKCRKLQYQYEYKLKQRTREIKMMNSQLMSTNNRLEKMVGSLKESMKERDVLLKEVHHRVKNNMQIISSLLNLQSAHVEDEKIRSIFHNSQLRISSMAMVHEMLYKSDNFSRIECSEYVETMVSKLITSFRGLKHNITTDIRVPTMHLSIDTAVPLGLIINEIVTNSIKHGLRNREQGTIFLTIDNVGDGVFAMKIGDNGAGIRINGNGHQGGNSLGLMLIDDLTEQLNGDVTLSSGEEGSGTQYDITFTEQKQKKVAVNVS